jgi:hypothetical protein
MRLVSVVVKGVSAGALGAVALNAVTYLDMVLRARPASALPQQAVSALSERMGHPVPGEGDARAARLEGLGALSGLATGVAIGTVAELAAPLLTRLPRSLAWLLVGGGAMLATDVPMTRMGLTDPKSWSASDWASDAVPHLAYGMATVTALRGLGTKPAG